MLDMTGIAVVLVLVYAVLGYFKPGVALVTVAFVALALGFAAVVADEMENLLFAPLLLLVTLIVVAVSNRDPDSRNWAHRWASWILVTIASLLLIASIFVVAEVIGAGPVLPLFAVLGIVAVIASLVSYGTSSGKAVSMQVISTLGASMKQNLPLPMALECAASGRDDASARTFRRIKKWLVQGYPLVHSIQRGYPQCPSRALAMLAAGERLGQLPAAFEAIRTDLKARALERRRLRPVHPFYPVVILTIMFLLILAIMTFVMPTFKAVLEEMTGGTPLPAPTRVLIAITGLLVYDTHLWLLLVLSPLVVLLIWLCGHRGRRRPQEPHMFSLVGDFLKWHLPLLHWFEVNYSTLQTVELLKLSLRAGSPVDEAIAGTLELDVNHYFRKQLTCWHGRVQGGIDVAQAARDCGLGTALAWAFDTSAGAAHAPAVLDMLESFYRSNYSYRVNLARFILWPCAIVGLGLTVGFVVLAIFLPGMMVLGQMASYVYP
ncbi:MAG: type II secretion system F family protein [Sedimentisphaerales bacterium]|nr:type II secretion system F family protein [Sedimentisphaerales bacterium]